MRQMKDSGIEWIGEIPESWNLSRYKFFTDNRMGETILASETVETGIPVYSATQEDKLFGYVSSANLILQKNDFVIPARGNSIGCVSIVKEDIATCTQTTICSKNIHGIDLLYLYYCCWGLKSEWFKYEGSAIPQISVEQVKNNIVTIPPKEEQHRISAYLDRQCALIDSVVEKTKASIEEYKKLRQAVITQVVTKGVRGDRAMKDSGIEWIGEIPEEWDIVKFKYIATVKSNLVHPNDYPNYMQIAPDNIEKGNAKLLECKTVEEIGVESDNHLFYKGQIIYSKIRPILNKVIIAPFDGLCSADMYPIETSINKFFLVYMMLSDRFLAQVKLVTENRVKMPKINQEELGQILIYLPQENEQQEIAEYLDKKCTEIDTLISKKEQFLTELEAYKKSLIYEYVTGKKEVPQA